MKVFPASKLLSLSVYIFNLFQMLFRLCYFSTMEMGKFAGKVLLIRNETFPSFLASFLIPDPARPITICQTFPHSFPHHDWTLSLIMIFNLFIKIFAPPSYQRWLYLTHLHDYTCRTSSSSILIICSSLKFKHDNLTIFRVSFLMESFGLLMLSLAMAEPWAHIH